MARFSNRLLTVTASLATGLTLAGCLSVSSFTPRTQAVDLAAPPPPYENATLGAVPLQPEELLRAPVGAHNFTAMDEQGTAQSVPDFPHEGIIELTAEQAVLSALSRNRALAVQQFGPVITGTFIDTERSVFDPVLFAEASVSRDTRRTYDQSAGRFFSIDGSGHTIRAGASQRFVTGTDVSIDITQSGSDSDTSTGTEQTRAGLNLTQALLRGGGAAVNLASLRQAETEALASSYNLRGFAENLVAEVESAYWNYALAVRQVEIFEESFALAERQLEEADARIEVGQIAETERAVADAELALRRQQLIDARNGRERARLELLRLINPPSTAEGWERAITLTDDPLVPEVSLGSAGEHEALAMKLRPELNEARLQALSGELETVQTANGLLPQLDLFANLGKTGYARSVSGSAGDLDGPGYDFTAGLNFAFPAHNRAARAADRRARASYRQALESIENLKQLVSLDVRSALLEIDRSLQQIEASAARRSLQEEVLRAENARFSVGNSTALEVARVQRDLLESRINEVEAVVNYRHALINLYRLDGTLLLRRGIEGPGGEEVVF